MKEKIYTLLSIFKRYFLSIIDIIKLLKTQLQAVVTGKKKLCSSQSSLMEETTRTITSLPLCNSLHTLHLPFDLVVEILCRLPVKHLLQLRCVCKSWNSLISGDSNFAKKHLRLSNPSHLILSAPRSPPEFILLHFPISSIFCSASITSVKQFKYPVSEIIIREKYDDRTSTCDGIVCVRLNGCSVMLCNPSIRKFKMLPAPFKPSDQKFLLSSYTLVRDRFSNNYKIIAASAFLNKVAVTLHTLGTDYWIRIQDFPGYGLTTTPISGTFVNDSVNWLTYSFPPGGHYKFIVSLDLEKESYKKISLPFSVDDKSFMTIGALRGCLSFLVDIGCVGFSDVWIMKEYGNEKSWIKLLRVPPMEEPKFDHYKRALYISKDDKVLMECCSKYSLVIYDSINNTFNIPELENNICGEIVAQEVYIESLISPL